MCRIGAIFVYRMRTNIDIDDALMEEALKQTQARTKKEVVETALRELVASRRRRRALDLEGRVTWHGDLDSLRELR
jgi:Arc/MetJ family transcription regulator